MAKDGRTVYDGCHQRSQGGGGLPISCHAGVRVMDRLMIIIILITLIMMMKMMIIIIYYHDL